MKILHVIASLSRHDGGPPKAVRDMARATAGRGHEVWIYATDKVQPDEPAPPLDKTVHEGRARIRYFRLAHPHAWKRSPAMGRALAAIIPGCDLVVIHSLYLYHCWRTAALCRRFGIPYVIRPHGTLDPYLQRRRRWLKLPFELWHQNRDLREASALHYTTGAERELAAPFVHGAPGFVVPLGLWPEAHPSPDTRRRHGDTLLYLGRLHPKKGIELLLDAFARVLVDHPSLRLRIAGSGEPGYSDGLRRRCTRHDLRGRAELIGYVEGAAKRSLLENSDLFVLPSHTENFGIAVIEAMAAQLPVLVSKHVNLRDAVEDADAGWVCTTDVDSVEATLRQALTQQSEWPLLGERGRAYVLDHYAWPVLAGQLEREYQCLIDANQSQI